MPIVSIVVPVYKVEKYLENCVKSLQNQTFEDKEIILVDDGSPDKCGEICDRLASADKQIVVIHQANGGLSAARNAGFKAAKGEYICFVDSDDYVAPEYCEVLYNLLCDTDYDFSVCGTCRFKEGEAPKPENNDLDGAFSNAEFLEMQLTRKSEFGVWNKMYRRKLIERMQFYPKKIHEDVIWSADLAKNFSNGVVCTGRQMYYYRQNSSGIVQQAAKKCSPDRIFAGEHLSNTVKTVHPQMYMKSLIYAIEYPWMFVDGIYVHREFKPNKAFMESMQAYLRKYIDEYKSKGVFSAILLSRMSLFAKSKFLYAFNAYARLFRVYLYRLLHLDAYKDGHGI